MFVEQLSELYFICPNYLPIYSCQRTGCPSPPNPFYKARKLVSAKIRHRQRPSSTHSPLCTFNSALEMVGLTGLEPVTLRLSSACSNQLSYRPIGKCRVESLECRMHSTQSAPHLIAQPFTTHYSPLFIQNGGAEEARTPDL